jgi:hypothetical protein
MVRGDHRKNPGLGASLLEGALVVLRSGSPPPDDCEDPDSEPPSKVLPRSGGMERRSDALPGAAGSMRVRLWLGAVGKGETMRLWKPNIRRLAARQDVRRLMECLDDRDPEIRQRAANALGGLADRVAVGSLVAAIDDAEEAVSVAAVAALGSLRDPTAVDPLCALLGRASERCAVRRAALEALGKIGGEGALQALTDEVATTGHERTSEVAVQALLAFPDEVPLSVFGLALWHGGRVARELAAARLCERIGRQDLDLLVPALFDFTQPQIGVPAALLFVRHGDVRGVHFLFSVMAAPPRNNSGLLDFHASARDTLLGLMSDDSPLLSIDTLRQLAELEDIDRQEMYQIEDDPLHHLGYDWVTQDYASVRAAARQALHARGVTVDLPVGARKSDRRSPLRRPCGDLACDPT